jgi:tetrahydromethanopterin S-methyltransferase subunit E
MDINKTLVGVLSAEAALCFLVWRSFEKPQIDQNTAIAWCAIALVAGCLLRAFSGAKLWVGFLGVVVAALVANILNITIDVSRDPTSHNLFPFELVLTAVIAAFGGIVGLGLGSVFWRRG